ncbi:MAG TPA: hypothetical protein VE690_08620, partial [Rhodopila sp.]|nr:hypothetical protein [Rhodopila sp.]
AVWRVRHRSAALGLLAPPVGGPKLGIVIGAVLAALCQSQGVLAAPMSIVLLGILLAATRPHALMQLIALVVAQNGIALAGCHAPAGFGVPLAGLVLPVPLAGALIAGYPRPGWGVMSPPAAHAIGWVRFAASVGLFIVTITVPLDPIAAVFAPLLAFDGMLRAWAERTRVAAAPFGHAAALIRAGLIVLAVASPVPLTAWFGITGAMIAALFPVMERCWPQVTLGLCAAAFALLGLLAEGAGIPAAGYPALFIGYAVVAILVPPLAVPLTVLVLRQVATPEWAPAAAWLVSGIGLAGMLACAVMLQCGLTRRPLGHHPLGRHRLTLLYLGQVAVALVAIGTDRPDGRYAAAILLILLILTRAASRFGTGPAAALAAAGLGGVPPLGVFPALILVVLAVCGTAPWLLLPLGAALVLMASASLPLRRPALDSRTALLSAAWLPLALAVLVGFLTPDSLARWLRLLAAGAS